MILKNEKILFRISKGQTLKISKLSKKDQAFVLFLLKIREKFNSLRKYSANPS